MRLRVKFTKTGCLKFIGHLDVMRYFQKALRRAEIPVALSEGFSPHMIMSFAQPLGVGKTSGGEYFDVDLKEDMCPEVFTEKLNEQMAEGIQVLHAIPVPVEKKYKGMTMVAAADYLVSFRKGKVTIPEADSAQDGSDPVPAYLAEKLNAFLEQPSISIMKKTKRSEAEVDIRPLIYRMKLTALPEEMQKEHPSGSETEPYAFSMLVSAKSGTNLKPELVMHAFASFADFSFEDVHLLIHRVDTLANAGTEEKPSFVPLDDPGLFL